MVASGGSTRSCRSNGNASFIERLHTDVGSARGGPRSRVRRRAALAAAEDPGPRLGWPVAWNRLQGSLVELSDTANRVRGRLALAPVSAAAPRPDDRRVGAFSRVWSTGDPNPASPDSRSEAASVAGADTSGAARGSLAGQPALVR
jgi:hypothetical protein